VNYVYELFRELREYEREIHNNKVHWSKKKSLIINKFNELLKVLPNDKKDCAIKRFERNYYNLDYK
jgi:hypothetical protein